MSMKDIKDHAHSVHRSRHAHLGMGGSSKHPGYAANGGRAHSDVAEDKALVRKMVKPEALERKRGGGVHKKDPHTRVNVIIGNPGGQQQPQPMPVPVPVGGPPPGGAAPAMGARPMPAAGGAPMGGIGGTAGLPPRKRGGRVAR